VKLAPEARAYARWGAGVVNNEEVNIGKLSYDFMTGEITLRKPGSAPDIIPVPREMQR
jgi:hypothetical protein